MSSDMKKLSVPLLDGTTWTANWRNSDHHLGAESFLFNADDFRDILKEPNVAFVRIYIGLRVNSSNNLEPKMICVGADANQKDILSVPDADSTDAGRGSGVYDFSNPCPPLCGDTSSPLAGGAS
ncbi:MAG: hypothetical protein P0Y53_17780 [Candidatus Pseudobacter hemicellulosilyticus]|uniref:Uncharacterized protein n=1 Tax=Candidatus Pseudobacter hemicellulosilyticus TaxID=3121375 RepID=A0AAJ6BG26_9BACT|nr:MAG: hypothetical protein P0Y53_17780 [Pseudobacter sp.]